MAPNSSPAREQYSRDSRRPHQSSRRRPSETEDVRTPDATYRTHRESSRRRQEDQSGSERRRRGSASNYNHSPVTPRQDKYRGFTMNTHELPPLPSPGTHPNDPMLEAGTPERTPAKNTPDFGRKRSLIRPERRRNDPNDPNFYYRQHAQHMNMPIQPSATGLDPQEEEDDFEQTSSNATLTRGQNSHEEYEKRVPLNPRAASKRVPNKLSRNATVKEARDQDEKIRRKRIEEASGAPTLWGTYCHLITFWCPNVVLRCFGKKEKRSQRAWREKIGLVSIILLIMTFVGYLTFGFTSTVCPSGGPLRLQVNKVGLGYMIFHGQAYDLTRSRHPLARGVPGGSNVLFDLDIKTGGKDGSFMFQNVNGACKGLITRAPNSDVPTDSNGNLAWYFPCNLYNQDGSSQPNTTVGQYLGYACHTQRVARNAFYSLRSSGDVYFTWDDVRNSSRNLMVYSGDVLDLDLLRWFNTTQVTPSPVFEQIRTNPAVRGIDTTLAFSSGENKNVAECLQQIVKVGSIDTETVGCIASKVVLYVSLIFILSIVVVKFLFAILFQWFFCRKYAADKTSMSSDKRKRQQQIEDWTDDIYQPPPKMTDPAPNAGALNKRHSFLPTTSRFTSPYAVDRSVARARQPPTTMTQQSARLSSVGTAGLYGRGNASDATLTGAPGTALESRTSLLDPSSRFSSALYDTDISGPQGFIHDAVVPQPPPEWQPFGYPLAHTICLVTAYSEGADGIRTTLDSIAMTDYPNSHKLMFVVCDGLIKGKGETMSTPDVCLSMMKDLAIHAEDVQPYSYVAVASGSKRHNMAKVYAGFYDYGDDSIIPAEKQQRVPMLLVVKCGTPAEASVAKPGNRGKRDSQIVLMSFLQKVMFDERMTELEYEMFNGIWKITGMSPDFYEIVLMVDADTKVFPDSLTHMVSAMVKDPEIMGLCGETKIANKRQSWVTMIQVFEYFISHHQAKSFESMFGGVTCLPGCFCMYRIKTPKGGQNYWVPILANPDIVEHYSENNVETLHKKNLLLLGEDRYLSTLMLKTFPKRKQVFVPQAVCKTTVPDSFKVLLSQRRRWINSTVHNLMELVLVRDLCGTFCFSMQFVVFIELVGTLVLPAAISFTVYLIAISIKAAIEHTEAPVIPLVLLALILGLPGLLIVVTAHRWSYVLWMLVYLLSLPVWNLILPAYAFWHFDDFSWGDTRQTSSGKESKGGHDGDGEFDSSRIRMKRWGDFESERRLKAPTWSQGTPTAATPSEHITYERVRPNKQSNLGQYVEEYHDYP